MLSYNLESFDYLKNTVKSWKTIRIPTYSVTLRPFAKYIFDIQALFCFLKYSFHSKSFLVLQSIQ